METADMFQYLLFIKWSSFRLLCILLEQVQSVHFGTGPTDRFTHSSSEGIKSLQLTRREQTNSPQKGWAAIKRYKVIVRHCATPSGF